MRERWARLSRWKWPAIALLALYVLGVEPHFEWGRITCASTFGRTQTLFEHRHVGLLAATFDIRFFEFDLTLGSYEGLGFGQEGSGWNEGCPGFQRRK